MRDRLAELKENKEPPISETSIDIDVGNEGNSEMKELADFFAEIEEIKRQISEVRRKIQEIDQLHGKTLSAIGGDSKGKGQELDKAMDSVNLEIQNIRGKLKAIESKNRQLGIDPGKQNLTAEQRIRQSQHGNVTKKFLEAVTEYQEIQIKYKTKFRDRIERQLRIVKPNATTEEIEHLIESGGESELFAQQILAGPQLAEARRALNDIQDRHQDIIKIEKSILELHQLFLDMAILVDAQGDMINQIENHVQSAADHTNKAVDEMKKAVKSQKKTRKRACCILFMILIMIVVISVVATRLVK